MVLVPSDFTALKLFYVEKAQTNLQLREEIMISTTEIIDGFDIHKSLNYVMVTTRDGTVNLFALKSREFVFKYCLEMRVKCSVDSHRYGFRPFRPLHDCWRSVSENAETSTLHKLYDTVSRNWHWPCLQKRSQSFRCQMLRMVKERQVRLCRHGTGQDLDMRV